MTINEKEKIVYYKDELNDDFSESNIKPIKIDGNYKYLHKNIFWNIAEFIIYRIIATFPSYVYTKLKFKLEIVNKKILKSVKKGQGYFVYANHTQEIVDTFFPTIINFPRRVYVIAHPDNVSIKGMKTLNRMLGAIPIPGNIQSSKNFLETIKKYINKGRVIAIYPEAHVWPYCTKIRNYKSVSFKYPVQLNAPAFACTTTYQKVKKNFTNKNKYNTKQEKNEDFRIVIYIDGPFLPDKTLSAKEAQEKLRNQIYEKMVERSLNSDIDIIKYEKK